MAIQFNLHNKYFIAIKSGYKTAEGRIAKAKYLELKPGDEIVFRSSNGREQLNARVTSVNIYDSFKSMLENEGIETMLPGITDIDEGVSIYSSFGTYAQDVREHGCVSIQFALHG